MVNVTATVMGVIGAVLMGLVFGWILGFILFMVFNHVAAFWGGIVLMVVAGFIWGYQRSIRKDEEELIHEYELQQARRNL